MEMVSQPTLMLMFIANLILATVLMLLQLDRSKIVHVSFAHLKVIMKHQLTLRFRFRLTARNITNH